MTENELAREPIAVYIARLTVPTYFGKHHIHGTTSSVIKKIKG